MGKLMVMHLPLVEEQTIGEPTGLVCDFSDILGKPLPDLRNGQKGGEDSFSILPALLEKKYHTATFS